MPFPDLARRDEGKLWTDATGVPENGNNTFALGFAPDVIVEPDWLIFDITAHGPSVTGATFVALSADRTHVTLNFLQGGTDPVTVVAQLVHTIER